MQARSVCFYWDEYMYKIHMVCVYIKENITGKHYMSNLYLQLPTFTTLYQCPQPKAAFRNIHKIQMLQVTLANSKKINQRTEQQSTLFAAS